MLAPTIDRDSCRSVPLAWPVQRSMRLVMSLSMLVGRHAAVKRQRLHGRALEDRQDVDRNQREAQHAQDDQRQRHDRHGVGIAQRSANQTVHVHISSL